MKKYFLKIVALAAIVALSFNVIAAASAAGEQQEKTLQVPLRFVCEAQDAEVIWDGAAKTASVTKGDYTFVVSPGRRQAVVNGKDVILDEEIETVNGRLMVPLSLINSALMTDIKEDDCLETLAVKYVDLLQQDAVSDCLMLYSGYLSQAATPDLVMQMAAGIKSFGELKLLNTAVDKNGVHQNVTLTYSSPIAGQMNYIIRFDYNAKIDDMLISAVNPMVYKTPDYDKPDNYVEKEVVIGDGQWQLPGKLTLPKGEGPFPVIVLAHGSGPNDMDESVGPLKLFRDLAVGLASQNIAVLRYDKRTYEHNMKFSLINNVTVKDEAIDDVFAAVDCLSAFPEIDTSRIFVLGHSQSGTFMPRIVKTDNEGKIKGAVIMSGCTRALPDVMLEQYEYLISLGMATKEQYDFYKEQFDILKSTDFSPADPPKDFLLGTPYWWEDVNTYRPAQDAEDLTSPLLVLQGERDYQVTAAEDFQGWKDALGDKPNVTFKLYPKLNHMYTEGEGEMSTPMEYYNRANIPSYVIDDIAQWVEEN